MSAKRLQMLSGCQNHRCAYCGVNMRVPGLPTYGRSLGKTPPWPALSWRHYKMYRKFRRATIEHVIAKSAGGTDALDNTVAACLFCNMYRANQPAEYALSRITRLVRRGSHPHMIFAKTGIFPIWNISGLPSIDMREAA